MMATLFSGLLVAESLLEAQNTVHQQFLANLAAKGCCDGGSSNSLCNNSDKTTMVDILMMGVAATTSTSAKAMVVGMEAVATIAVAAVTAATMVAGATPQYPPQCVVVCQICGKAGHNAYH